MTDAWRDAMQTVLGGGSLDRAAAHQLMATAMTGELSAVRVAALISALATRRETVDELVGFATAMRALAVPLPGATDAVDTCGTGGSGLATVNTSTMSAFVLAAAGVRVAKHGNRASSGRCGSSDVLEALGVPVSAGPQAAAQLIAETGLCFLFAPRYHPAMKHVMPVRRELGFRTVFNFLGPLANPAAVQRQLLGVSDVGRAPAMVAALAALGVHRALVVCGEDGLDEFSLAAPTRVWSLDAGVVVESVVTPESVGLATVPFAAIAGGEAADNVRLLRAILDGSERGPHRDHLILNAAGGLLVAGRVEDLRAGVALAAELIDTGAVSDRLARFQRAAVALEASK